MASIKSYSWTVYDEETASKQTDMSVFKNHGSGIPIEIRFFFEIDSFNSGDKKEITLILNDKEYAAKLERTRSSTQVTRIMWHSDLSDKFNRLFPFVLKNEQYPILNFFKIDSDHYEISFVDSVYENIIFNLEDDCIESKVVTYSKKEGKKIEFYTTKYERSPKNRSDAVKIHGTKCMVCGFDFGEYYGELGMNYIEVHHVKALSSLEDEVEINPKTDLVCVCSNCHRMIHRKKNHILSVDQLKALIMGNNTSLNYGNIR